MRIQKLHSWQVSPKDAIALQRDLASRVITQGTPGQIKTVAGADLGFSRYGEHAVAGVVVFSYPALEVIECVNVQARVPYPYVPGLLSFREGPVLEEAFAKLNNDPDVILFDGQGIAHPRRLGIASHMGLVLDCPTIGCAKSRLCGTNDEPGPEVGDWAELHDERTSETVGAVLRTRPGVKPIYVSIGHKLSLQSAIDIVIGCLDQTRIPKPTREADKYVRSLK